MFNLESFIVISFHHSKVKSLSHEAVSPMFLFPSPGQWPIYLHSASVGDFSILYVIGTFWYMVFSAWLFSLSVMF